MVLVLNTGGVPQVHYQLQQNVQQYLAIYTKKKILRILNVTVKSFSHIWLKFLSDTVWNIFADVDKKKYSFIRITLLHGTMFIHIMKYC